MAVLLKNIHEDLIDIDNSFHPKISPVVMFGNTFAGASPMED
jgi:hypothetical protein